jgi:hypothetical protein
MGVIALRLGDITSDSEADAIVNAANQLLLGLPAHTTGGVAIPQSDFTGPPVGHGYCASDPYFVSLSGALAAGNKPGAFHPNLAGHTITALATRVQLCTALYGNPACDGEPR